MSRGEYLHKMPCSFVHVLLLCQKPYRRYHYKTEWHYPLYKSLIRISVRQNNKKTKFWYATEQFEQIEHSIKSASQNAALILKKKKNQLISFTVVDTLNNHEVFTGFFVNIEL